MMLRAIISGGLNILGAQLSQEGSEGDINLLSAGLGALSGAMTAPGMQQITFAGDRSISQEKVLHQKVKQEKFGFDTFS